MWIDSLHGIGLMSSVSSANTAMKSVVSPIVNTLCAFASLVCAGLLVNAGIHYITSSGHPEKLERAKKIIKDAMIGLALVLGAAIITAILGHAYGSQAATPAQHLPSLAAVKPASTSLSLVDILIKAIAGLLQNIVESVGKPFINALQYFTSGTPLMAANNSVFNLWLITTGIADALFILAICLIGFNVMTAATLGLDEINIKSLLPQLGLVFLLINSSIFAIDTIITLSNGMISALRAGFGNASVWQTLSTVTDKSSGLGIAALIITIVFLALAFILLVYYVGRLVTLYLGAVLSPILLLAWLLPSFKDFAATAAKTYITTIFVLFVHVVILALASSIFANLIGTSDGQPDPIMSLVVGLSTLVALIKTQGVLAQLNYVSIGPKSIRKLGTMFVNGLSHQKVAA